MTTPGHVLVIFGIRKIKETDTKLILASKGKKKKQHKMHKNI